jgi:hypothetical protein
MTNELKEKILAWRDKANGIGFGYVVDESVMETEITELLAIIDEGIEEELNRCCPRD